MGLEEGNGAAAELQAGTGSRVSGCTLSDEGRTAAEESSTGNSILSPAICSFIAIEMEARVSLAESEMDSAAGYLSKPASAQGISWPFIISHASLVEYPL